jgi:hypothetical protein
MLPSFILATTMCLIGSFAVFDELVAMGALYVNPEAKLLSVLFFTYGFQIDRLAMGMTRDAGKVWNSRKALQELLALLDVDAGIDTIVRWT